MLKDDEMGGGVYQNMTYQQRKDSGYDKKNGALILDKSSTLAHEQ